MQEIRELPEIGNSGRFGNFETLGDSTKILDNQGTSLEHENHWNKSILVNTA